VKADLGGKELMFRVKCSKKLLLQKVISHHFKFQKIVSREF